MRGFLFSSIDLVSSFKDPLVSASDVDGRISGGLIFVSFSLKTLELSSDPESLECEQIEQEVAEQVESIIFELKHLNLGMKSYNKFTYAHPRFYSYKSLPLSWSLPRTFPVGHSFSLLY